MLSNAVSYLDSIALFWFQIKVTFYHCEFVYLFHGHVEKFQLWSAVSDVTLTLWQIHQNVFYNCNFNTLLTVELWGLKLKSIQWPHELENGLQIYGKMALRAAVS